MSVAIAVSLPDGTLLISDGKQSFPFNDEKSDRTDVDKFERIGPQSFVLPVGVTQATDVAVDQIRGSWSEVQTPEEGVSLMDEATYFGWQHLLARLADDVDLEDEAMKAGLVGGGMLGDAPFIGSVLIGYPDIRDQQLLTSPFNMLSLGSADSTTQKSFQQELQKRGIDPSRYETNTGPVNSVIETLIAAGRAAIRTAEAQHPQIGGTVRYVLIRADYELTRGTAE